MNSHIRGAKTPGIHSSASTRIWTATTIGAALSCALALPAHSQDAAQKATQSSVLEVPKITVEAETDSYKVDTSANQKLTAPLLDTPKSITVVNEEVMQEMGTTSLQEVLRTVPGITLGAGEGGVPSGDLPNIRGFGAEGNIQVDGMRDTGSATRDVFNLEQVEVMKGPGSAYNGRGSTGGSINLVTKRAKKGNSLSGTASASTPLGGRLTADGNYMLTDNAAVRLNVMAEDSEVAGRDEVYNSAIGFAPSFTWGLERDTRVSLSLYHMQTDDMPDYGIPYDTRTGQPAAVDRNNFYGLTNRDFQKTQEDSMTLDLEHDVSDRYTIRNVTRYKWSENDYIVTNPDDSRGNVVNGRVWRNTKSRNADSEVLSNQTDLSGEFETGGLKHSFNVGMELTHEETANRNYSVAVGSSNCAVAGLGAASGYNCASLFDPDPNDPWAGTILPSPSRTDTQVDTKAVYVFDTIELDPQWLVNGGLRYDMYETSQLSTNNQTGASTYRTNESNFFSYQLGLVFKPASNGSIYVSYGTSSDPSGSTAGEGRESLSANNSDLDPEESRSYEIGTKWDLFDRKLATTAAVFRTDKTNARVSDPLGGTNQVLDGEQRVQGIELGLSGNITDEWRIFGGYTFMRSEIINDGAGTDDGNEMPNVPAHSLNIWTTYDVLPDWTLGGGATYMSSRYGNTANTRKVPNYWKFDAMVEHAVTEDATVRLNVNNILDETYYEKPYTTHFATVAPGRSFVLSTAFKF